MQNSYRRQSESTIRRHLTAQPRSGMTIQSYCQRHQIGLSTFYWWKKRYGSQKEEKRSSKKTPTFRQVGIASLCAEPFRIHQGSIVIEVPQRFDGQSLVALLSCVNDQPKQEAF